MTQASENPFPIVGIGASAGGLNALTQLLDGLSPRPGLALVIVQHLDPHHQSRLRQLLQSHTTMSVVDAVEGAKVEPDHVYVIQPNTGVAIAGGALSVTPRPEDRRPYYPIDHFFRSLAAEQGPFAIGVILSGTGSDGTLGLCEVKAAGGVTFAQNEESAQHAGMPQSAIASGAVDLVLTPGEIAARLSALLQHAYLAPPRAEAAPKDESHGFQRVIAAVRATSARAGFDRHFTKPVDITALAGFLATIAGEGRTRNERSRARLEYVRFFHFLHDHSHVSRPMAQFVQKIS